MRHRLSCESLQIAVEDRTRRAGGKRSSACRPRFLDRAADLLVQVQLPHVFLPLLLSQYLPAVVSVQLYCADGDQVKRPATISC